MYHFEELSYCEKQDIEINQLRHLGKYSAKSFSFKIFQKAFHLYRRVF